MEIAKQELIAHAREAASRVLRELSGEHGSTFSVAVLGPCWSSPDRAPPLPNADRQTSEQMALDARKREQFQQLKEQFVKDQEVGGPDLWDFWLPKSAFSQQHCVYSLAAPGSQTGGTR